jgi:hypothetical protein
MALSGSLKSPTYNQRRIALAPLADAMVWLGIASGAVVFSEPAPVDMFWIALVFSTYTIPPIAPVSLPLVSCSCVAIGM